MEADDRALARPIGWWLKEADAQIDLAFERSLAGTGTDRRRWQVLTALADRPTDRAGLASAIERFDPRPVVDAVVDDLRSRGWVDEREGLLHLTADGESTHAASAPTVERIRRQVSDALPDDDYARLVGLLARLVSALATPPSTHSG